MAHFYSHDGAKLAYHRTGSGPPLVCLPGGPGLEPAYLGDLGGLGRSRELILPHSRGTGDSEVPADPAAYRCDRIAQDVEALRTELGLERMDLLGHSAGGNVALLYAAAHPERIGHLILLTPSVRALGLTFTDEEQHTTMRRRSAEPWFQSAWAAAEAADRGDDSAGTTLGYQPFFYGRWDDAARAHARLSLGDQAGPARPASTPRGRSTLPRRGPDWPASTPRCWSTPGSWTPRPLRSCWPRRPACSRAGRSPCSRGLATFPGWRIPPGSRVPSPRSCPVRHPGPA